MKWIVRIVPFALAFLLGASVAGSFSPATFLTSAECVNVPAPIAPVTVVPHVDLESPVAAEDLIGTWRGTWGYDRSFCTIEINRIKGDKFFGTLKKDGFVITIAGTLDPETRTVSFEETRIVRQGPEMGEWSLGKNKGSFSPSGVTMTGTGTDKWGTYGWDASKY